MRSPRTTILATLVAGAVCAAVALGAPTNAVPLPIGEHGRSITYSGVTRDVTDLSAFGADGFWFAHIDAPEPSTDRPTGERELEALPDWVAPFNHFSIQDPVDPWQGCVPESLARGCVPTFFFRTFSQDGPAHAAGGHPGWSDLTLAGGHRIRSGAIVDPHTAGASNNTVNRILLTGEVPATFYLHVVTDNTAGRHDPTQRLRARASMGLLDVDLQVESDIHPEDVGELTFNGVPDVYTYRFEGFQAGDYLKIQLRGESDGDGAGFAGVLFDETFDPPSSGTGPGRSDWGREQGDTRRPH